MNCQKGGCSCKQTQPNSTNFFFCPGPLATFCWPNLPIKIDIFSMDFDPNLEENYPRLQKLLVLVGSWTFKPTKLRFKAQAKQHQKGGGASNLWTRKVASPSLSLFFSSLIFSMVVASSGWLFRWFLKNVSCPAGLPDVAYFPPSGLFSSSVAGKNWWR